MKRGCFINCISMPDEKAIQSSGVMKKVYSQIKTLRTEFEVEHVLINTYGNKQTILKKIKRRLPFFPVDYHWKYTSQFSGYDFVYFRKSDIDYTVYKFFRDIKKNNPNCKILLEIPTYPYEKENFHGLKDTPIQIKDKVNHERFHKYIDRIVTFSNDKEIWNIKTIQTLNGIDFSNIELPKRKKTTEDIHMIEVSSPAYWHGYDRILEGMGEYYTSGGKRKIVFHIVGDGGEIKRYKELVSKYQIHDRVIFHGNMFGSELQKLYEKCYLGIDSIGRHRSGNSTNSSLKSREYAAHGIPFISSVPVDFGPQEWEFILHVHADDSPVNMIEVINFFDGIYNKYSTDEVANSIRTIAEKETDMLITMRPIIEYIKD